MHRTLLKEQETHRMCLNIKLIHYQEIHNLTFLGMVEFQQMQLGKEQDDI